MSERHHCFATAARAPSRAIARQRREHLESASSRDGDASGPVSSGAIAASIRVRPGSAAMARVYNVVDSVSSRSDSQEGSRRVAPHMPTVSIILPTCDWSAVPPARSRLGFRADVRGLGADRRGRRLGRGNDEPICAASSPRVCASCTPRIREDRRALETPRSRQRPEDMSRSWTRTTCGSPTSSQGSSPPCVRNSGASGATQPSRSSTPRARRWRRNAIAAGPRMAGTFLRKWYSTGASIRTPAVLAEHGARARGRSIRRGDRSQRGLRLVDADLRSEVRPA